jgi:hypothetical protein
VQYLADISISKVLHFIQSAGLLNSEENSCTKDWKWSNSKLHGGAHPNAY